MTGINIELQRQIDENISLHKDIAKMSKDIFDIIKNIKKKLKNGGKILF